LIILIILGEEYKLWRGSYYKIYEAYVLIVIAVLVLFLWRKEWEKKLTWTRTHACNGKTNIFTEPSLQGEHYVVIIIFFLQCTIWEKRGETFGYHSTPVQKNLHNLMNKFCHSCFFTFNISRFLDSHIIFITFRRCFITIVLTFKLLFLRNWECNFFTLKLMHVSAKLTIFLLLSLWEEDLMYLLFFVVHCFRDTRCNRQTFGYDVWI
jgi:hypothetical protein